MDEHWGGFYVGAKWQASADFLESKLNRVDKSTRVEFLRTLLLNYAHLGNLKNFRITVKKADALLGSLDKLDLLDSDNIVSLLEALARSFSIFGLTKDATKVFSLADNFSSSPFYQSQILRGKIFNLYQEQISGINIDRDEFKNLLNASQDAKYAPFLRHQKQNSGLARKLGINYGKN